MFLCTARERPMALEFESGSVARRWRLVCYRIRDVLRLVGDTRFNNLKLEIQDNKLHAEMRDAT
jgi:hypothetical protein